MLKHKYNAFISHKIEIAPGLAILRVGPDGWEIPKFIPGQFAVLGLFISEPRCHCSEPETKCRKPTTLIRRAYSISSSAVINEYLEFYINLIYSGTLTPRLFSLEVGDRLWLSIKFSGLFALSDVSEEKDILMIATGTGLAPYMSMLRTFLKSQPQRRFTLLHGARHSCDLGYQTELIALQSLCNNFHYLPIISRPRDEHLQWNGPVGHVQSFWTSGILDQHLGFHPSPKDTEVFLCGNPKMVRETFEMLSKEGYQAQTKKNSGDVHVEQYW